MAQIPELVTAITREGKFNKNAARRVRVAGKIPAVVYGAGQDAVAIEVDPKQIQKILWSESGHNTIFDLELKAADSAAGAKTKVMIVDWQYEPIKDKLIHIDMKRIAMDKMMRVEVPVQLTGIPAGVRLEGGILEQVLREIEIECLPSDIPSHIDFDVTNLKLNDAVHVSDLPHGGKLKFITDETATVAHVTIVKEEAAPVVDATAAAAEPEVVKKGKQDADAAAPAAGDKKDSKK